MGEQELGVGRKESAQPRERLGGKQLATQEPKRWGWREAPQDWPMVLPVCAELGVAM